MDRHPEVTKPSLTLEQEFLLDVLRDYLNGATTTVPEALNMDAFLQLCGGQKLLPFVYSQTGIEVCRQPTMEAVFHSTKRKSLLDGLDARCHEANLPYLVLKGPEIAQYYRHPYFRISGDIDLLVHHEDAEKADRILIDLGFTSPESKLKTHEWAYTKPNLTLELHDRLMYEDVSIDTAALTFANSVWEHTVTEDGIHYHMEPEFQFVFMLLHLRKHFLYAGIGIRLFYDLVWMLKKENLNQQKIRQYLDACEITPFAKVCFAFIERWFGVPCLIEAAEISDDFFISSTCTILSEGLFGNMKEEETEKRRVAFNNYKYGKKSAALRILFPDFRHMSQKYPRLGKYKILLPFLWGCRIVELILKRNSKKGMENIGKQLAKDDNEQQTASTLSAWGL